MNVSINGRVFSVNQPGGAGQAGIALVQALRNSDIDITVYGHNDAKQELPEASINSSYFPINSQLYGLFWEQVILPRIVSQSTVDVLFCPTMNAPLFELDIPVVVQVHDIFRFKGDVSRLDKLRQHFRLPRMLASANKVITVSEFSKSEISKYLNIEKSKIDVIYNGVDPIFFNKSIGATINVPSKYILYVGGTNSRKNIPRLVDTFEKLRTEFGVDHELVMVGPEPKRFHNYPLTDIDENHIHVTGYISQENLKYVYENADIFLFPSLYEGFGMAPLEAMACRTPVVASNRTSLPEVLGDGAILVNPEDVGSISNAVYDVLTNQELRRETVQKGRERASEFRWEKSAQELSEVFYDLS